MRLVEKWWKAWSAQLLLACLFLAELAAYLPEVKENLPEEWYRYAFIVILVARVVKQKSVP
jgi:hypothetical protein